MIHLLTRDDAAQWTRNQRDSGHSIGLVPTQGALHAGHASLIRAACAANDTVVVSVFVNPIQFRHEGYTAYPRSLDLDLELARDSGAAAVFAPSVEDMYPGAGGAESILEFAHGEQPPRDTESFRSDPLPGDLGDAYVKVPSSLALKLDGHKHPWHFDGVATVVRQLHEALTPDRAYYGEKDIQQFAIIRAMNRWLGDPVVIVPVPISRDHDGVSTSSRLFTLNTQQRTVASRVAQAALSCSIGDPLTDVRRSLGKIDGLVLDDVSLVNIHTLDQADSVQRESALYVAYFIGETRLQECVYF